MSKAKNQRFRLLTTCIVAALHPNEQSPRGAVWEPDNVNDTQEALALRNVGYAEETSEDVTHETVSQRQAAASRANKPDGEPAEDDDVETPLADILAGNVDEVTAALADLTAEQLKALADLEAKGGNRKGVQNAIAQYLAAE